MLHTLSLALFPTLLIIAATSDVMTYRIPNWLTVLIALLFFPMAFATAMPLGAFTWHLLAGVLLFTIGFIFFQLNLMGGGDAKLFGAAGLWFGMTSVPAFLELTAFAGLLQVIFMMGWAVVMFSANISADDSRMAGLWARLRPVTPNVPFGFAIALGGIVAFQNTWWLRGLE